MKKLKILNEEDLQYFKRGELENPKFWSRLGGEPSFKNKKILDIGCGHGSLAIFIALRGAKEVIGVDINKKLIKFANQNLNQNYPQLKKIVKFKNCNISELNTSNFDIIVSKDSLEHIIELYKCLSQIKFKLNPDGKVYFGFGPLYNSPFGDHGRLKAKILWEHVKIPWGHIILPEKFLINRLNKKNGTNITNVEELGLNKFSLKDYKTIFNKSGLKIEFLKTNVSKKLSSKILNLMKVCPFIKEYFTHNIYCIL